MIFEFGGAPELPSPREAVWRHLQDGDTLAACTPGAESFEVRGPGRYSVKCGVGCRADPRPCDARGGVARSGPPGEPPPARRGDRAGLDARRGHHGSARSDRPRTHPSRMAFDHRGARDAGQVRTRDGGRGSAPVHRDVLAECGGSAGFRPPERRLSLSAAELLALPAAVLPGAIVLAGIDLEDRTLGKGRRLDAADAVALFAAARIGALTAPVQLAWADTHELHEEEAALAPGLGFDRRRCHGTRTATQRGSM